MSYGETDMSDYGDYPTLEERMEAAMPFRHEPPEKTIPTTRYAEGARTRGLCSVCGDSSPHKQSKKYKGKYPTVPYYFKVFDKIGWFRGDDEYLGKICKKCLKEGKIEQVKKLTTNQEK